MAFNRVVSLALLAFVLFGWAQGADPPAKPNITREEGVCIWYGGCTKSKINGADNQFNCFYNGPAKKLEENTTLYNLIRDTCPQYLDRGVVCCDEHQMSILAKQMSTPEGLFDRCPACYKNFLNHFCGTTCDPDQSVWIDPEPFLTYGPADNGTNVWYMKAVNIYVTMDYVNNLYQSCENVQYPADSSKVVDIMCGATESCNSTKWIDYLAAPDQNNESPFPMYYIYGKNDSELPENMTSRDFDFIQCDASGEYQCSCSDCPTPKLCPPPPTANASTFPIFDITVGVISGGGVLSTLIFLIALFVSCCQMLSKREGYTKIDRKGHSTQGEHYGAVEDDDGDNSPVSSVGSINDDEKDFDKMDPGEDGLTCCMAYNKIGAMFEIWIKVIFYKWGKFVADFWYIVFVVVAVILIALSCGLFFFKITTDPVQLWSAPTSRARLEKDYFDENFGPFYRTEMLIITAKEQSYDMFIPSDVINPKLWTFGPALNKNVMHETLTIITHLTNMEVPYQDDDGPSMNITLDDICFKPLGNANNTNNASCAIMTVLNYFQNSFDNLNHEEEFQLVNYTYHIHYCTRNPTAVKGTYFSDQPMSCLGAFGGPIDPNIVLGGFPLNEDGQTYNYQNATAQIVTFTVTNHIDESKNKKARAWEKAFLDYIQAYEPQYINITYSTERSIEDELDRESETDVGTILISYGLMFLYITVFLGHMRSLATIMIDMKVTVGFLGVLMVLLAVVSSIGLLSYIGITATLIILEVVPFLVLAVGVDNLFILVHSYERQAKKFAKIYDGNIKHAPVRELIGRAVGEVAPSLLLTSFSETAAFLLGGISTMPAVRTFSFYAGVAVFFNFLLQISLFVGLLALDAHRQLANRFDILCCIKIKGRFDPRAGYDILHIIMKYFAKALLYPVVRPFVLLFFGLSSTASLALLFRIQVGLEQTAALPKDSYLMPYFDELYKYLHTGSPVYFVIRDGVNFSDPNLQNAICSGAGCNNNSLGTQIAVYSRASNLTGIAEPAMLWLDTYYQWLAPKSKCCGITDKNQECNAKSDPSCHTCLEPGERNLSRPNVTEFERYLKRFLNDNPGVDCPFGGHAGFSSGVKLNPDGKTVKTSNVMTYHTILSTSDEFVSALKWARELGDQISEAIGHQVFPYSVFYVYYEQYLTSVRDMGINIGVSIGAVFLVTFLMMGLNLWAALIVILTVCMVILHMLGFMYLVGVHANAISLVNLVMTVGIAVEFCSHIVRWFCSCPLPTRLLRARSALANMGASVVSGITITKFIGVFVLLFAKSQIFDIYYFRMYMLMLLWGALHGLVFLPVLLSYVGPPFHSIKDLPSPYDDSAIRPPTSSHDNDVKNNSDSPKLHPRTPPTPNGTRSPAPPPHSTNTSTGTNQVYPILPADYPGATYPGQQRYQEEGRVYGSGVSNETSRLINH